MVVVGVVVVGADRHAEIAAGAAVHGAQEAGLGAVALPMPATEMRRPSASLKAPMSTALAVACSLRQLFQTALPMMLRQE